MITPSAAKYRIKLSTGDWQIVAISTWSAPMESLVTIMGTTQPVTGLGLDFSISTFPAGATGQELSKSSETTNAGLADVLLKLGNIPAEYGVTATCRDCDASASTVTFTCCGKLPNDDFKQADPSWATYPYNTQTKSYTKNIGAVGCALTAFATVINYYATTFTDFKISTTTPKKLNDTLLNKTNVSGFDPSHNVRFEVVVDTNVSNGKLLLDSKLDFQLPLTIQNQEKISKVLHDNLVKSKKTVIAKVYRSWINPKTSKKEEWSHFVVLVGRCGDRYVISDPGSQVRKLIDPFVPVINDLATQNTFGPIVGLRIVSEK